MRIQICAGGRMKASPFADLFTDYQNRFNQQGPTIGLTGCDLTEFDDNPSTPNKTKTATAAKLDKVRTESAVAVILDETGKHLTSPALADKLAGWRDDGHSLCTFFIGDAYGFDDTFRQSADLCLSLGTFTYPHLMARVILMEQLYRSVCILKGHPYHHG